MFDFVDDCSVEYLGPPGRPKGPLEVLDVQKDSVTIAWKPPEDNGGRPITLVQVDSVEQNWRCLKRCNRSFGALHNRNFFLISY